MPKKQSSSKSSANTSDAGGVAARQGFKYQDHVAAQYVIEMLSDDNLTHVECETHDDIVLVRNGGASVCNEYVQVKTTESDKKWALKEIKERSIAKRPTSLVEKSLLCDSEPQRARFRIVSKRDVAKSLRCLTTPLEERTDDQEIRTIGTSLAKLKTVSPNGNDLSYWAQNAVWQVCGNLDALIASNQKKLLLLAERYGANPTHTQLIDAYEELLGKVDRAASASKTMPSNKMLRRDDILSWWSEKLLETEAAIKKSSKPYRMDTEGFFVQLHRLEEGSLLRYMTSYDAGYENEVWRCAELVDYLADWLPEVTLKASELVEVRPLMLRRKLRGALREIARHRQIDAGRLLAETMLHSVLRHYLRSEPIACKLFYQSTNGSKTFSSSHIVRNNGKDEMWLGRAEIAAQDDYEDVVQRIVASVSSVLDPDFLKEEREVILTLREPQHMLPNTLEKSLLRQSSIDQLVSVLCIPVLIAYDSVVLSGGFREGYDADLISEVVALYEGLKPRLPETLKTVKVHIFLVPVEHIDQLVSQFNSIITLPI